MQYYGMFGWVVCGKFLLIFFAFENGVESDGFWDFRLWFHIIMKQKFLRQFKFKIL